MQRNTIFYCSQMRPSRVGVHIWSDTEKNLHINVLELKAVFFGIFSVPPVEQEGLGGLRQCNSSILSQQTRGDPFLGNLPNDVASDCLLQSQSNFAKGSTHTGLSECDSRQPVTQGQNYTNRMVSSSKNFLMICQI